MCPKPRAFCEGNECAQDNPGYFRGGMQVLKTPGNKRGECKASKPRSFDEGNANRQNPGQLTGEMELPITPAKHVSRGAQVKKTPGICIAGFRRGAEEAAEEAPEENFSFSPPASGIHVPRAHTQLRLARPHARNETISHSRVRWQADALPFHSDKLK